MNEMQGKSFLRKRAEELLRSKGVQDKSLYAKNLESLVEELSIYQIELEHQNNELLLTQQRLNEAKDQLADLFYNAPVGYLILRDNYLIEEINYTAAALLPVQTEALKGSKITRFIHPEDQDDFYFHLKEAFDTENTVTSDIRIRKNSEGEFFYARILSKIDDYFSTEYDRVRMTIIDVTVEKAHEHKQEKEKLQALESDRIKSTFLEDLSSLNTQIEKARKKAEESDEIKSAFLAHLSHEICAPLNAIIGFSHLLDTQTVSPNHAKKFTDLIYQSGEQLLQLINDIIDLSKIESNQLRVNKKKVLVESLMKEVFEISGQENRNRRSDAVAFELKTPASLSGQLIETDPVRFKQIFFNLIGNAMKFTKFGKITFGLEMLEGYAHFYVKDTGIGIAPNMQELIFHRFRQVETDMVKEGNGLGLPIAKALVELMGGTIGLESELHKGTTFYVHFPFDQLNTLASRSDDTNFEEQQPMKDLSEFLIYVAEDDDKSFLLLEELLKPAKLRLKRAVNGEELIDMINQHKPDAILLDINMPRMSGYEAIRIIRKMGMTIPVIAQTPYTMMEDRDMLTEAGFDDYLSKPILPSKLMEAIKKVLMVA